MRNLTADQVLHKTFEHLDQMLDQNSRNDLEKQEKSPEFLADSEQSACDKKKSCTNTDRKSVV